MTLRHILTRANLRQWFAGKFGIFVGSFILAFALVFLSRRYLVFKNEVQVGDLINFFSGVLVALIVQNAIERRLSNVRVEKDLLISRISAMDTALNETHKLFLKRAADVNAVDDSGMFASFGDLSNHLWI